MEGLTEQDVSRILGCSDRHVRRLRKEGKLRTDKIENKLRYRRQDVVDYMERKVLRADMITISEASKRGDIPPTTIYSAIKDYRVRFKKYKPRDTRVYWPDCDELYRQCSLKNHEMRNSPELEELFGIK